MLTEVDTSGELFSLTCLASTPNQLALKCMFYNGLLIVVVRGSTGRVNMLSFNYFSLSVDSIIAFFEGITPIYFVHICSQS